MFVGDAVRGSAIAARSRTSARSAVIAAIAMGILFLGGMNWRLFAGLVVLLMLGFVVIILTSPYRMQRILGFMDPWADPYGKHISCPTIIAFGRGEWLAWGWARSVESFSSFPRRTRIWLGIIGEDGSPGITARRRRAVRLVSVMRAFAHRAQAARFERHQRAGRAGSASG